MWPDIEQLLKYNLPSVMPTFKFGLKRYTIICNSFWLTRKEK